MFVTKESATSASGPLTLALTYVRACRYAEDVTRLVEKEVQEVEEEIRAFYPEAAFIELEPDSKESEMRAIVNMQTVSSRTSEREAMTRALAHLARTLERKPTADRDNVL